MTSEQRNEIYHESTRLDREYNKSSQIVSSYIDKHWKNPTRNFDFQKSENERKEFIKHIKREDVLKDAKKKNKQSKTIKRKRTEFIL